MRKVRGEAFRSTSRKLRNSSTSLSREAAVRRLLRFFDLVTVVTRFAVLAFENGCRIRRDQLVVHQHELRVDAVTRRLVNVVAAEVAVELVFIIVVEAEIYLFAIGGELVVFVQHYQLRL